MDSSLASAFYQAKYYSKGRSGRNIEMITIHHMASVISAKRCGEIFQNRQASSHYGIGVDGEIAQYVNEADTSWANANWDANCKAITIETANDSTGGEWHVGDKALNSLIKLVADIAKRRNLGTLVKGKNVTWHRMYCATTCPGEYLLSKMDYIVSEANKINQNEATKPVENTTKVDTGIIANIQKTLNSRYGLNIAVDNIAGSQTKSALVRGLQLELNKQYNKGVVVDGIFGNQTKSACITLKKGAQGNITYIMQARLTCLGYIGNGQDGSFGNKTLEEVKQFQNAKGIVVDGIVGKQTWGKLFE